LREKHLHERDAGHAAREKKNEVDALTCREATGDLFNEKERGKSSQDIRWGVGGKFQKEAL